MRRFFWALLFGISFPVIYTIVLGTISNIYPKLVPDSTVMFGQEVPGYAFAPTMFPSYFLFWLKANGNFGWSFIVDTIPVRILFLILPNLILYSLLGHVVLSTFRLPRKKVQINSDNPPPPPNF